MAGQVIAKFYGIGKETGRGRIAIIQRIDKNGEAFKRYRCAVLNCVSDISSDIDRNKSLYIFSMSEDNALKHATNTFSIYERLDQ